MRYKTQQAILNDNSLTPYQTETETIILHNAFTRDQQIEMFRLLRDLVAKNESDLHYHGDNYLRYLLEKCNTFFNYSRRTMDIS